MKVVLAGVEGVEEALGSAGAGLVIVRLDADADAATAREALDGALAAVLSRAIYDRLGEAGVPLDLPVICSIDSDTHPEELRTLSRRGVRRLMFEPPDPREVVREIERITGRDLAPVTPSSPSGAGRQTDAPAAAEIAAIWAEFRDTMLERLGRLERVGGALLDGDRPRDAMDAARTAAHKLRGSLGTFGHARGSEISAELEEILVRGAPAENDVFRYSELLVELREVLERSEPDPAAAPLAAATPQRTTYGVRIQALVRDEARGEALAAAALGRGWSLTATENLETLMAGVAERPPALLILDPSAADPAALEGWLRRLALYPPRVPVLFWTGASDIAGRLRAAAAGVRGVIEAELGPDAVMERAAAILEGPQEGLTILVVDDDATMVALSGAALSDELFRVVGLTDPLRFWETLESVHPDLLLLDMEMPQVSGMELCRIVRASARWRHLPVIFLTARNDPETFTRAFRAGADDYVIKPVHGPELRSRVLHRLERFRAQSGAPSARGGESADRSAALQRAATALAIARRNGDEATVAVVRLAEPEGGDVRVPLARVTGTLREAARAEDVVVRWSDRSVALLLYGMSREAAEAWLRDRARPQSEDRWQAQLGSAAYPGDGESFEALVDRADRRADGKSGTDQPSGESASERVDVVLVEDDEALATLLLHSLSARELTTRWIRDGVEAAERLAADPPSLVGRVILLDIGLPGLDGLTLLKRLAESGTTRSTRVVMLTARAAEAEVIRALDLGAFDHVPKPFSVAELMHRVRRALEAGGRS